MPQEVGATSPGRRRPAPMDNGGDTTENLLFFLCCKWLCKHTGAHLQGPHSRAARQLANDTTMRMFGRNDSFLIGRPAIMPTALMFCTVCSRPHGIHVEPTSTAVGGYGRCGSVVPIDGKPLAGAEFRVAGQVAVGSGIGFHFHSDNSQRLHNHAISCPMGPNKICRTERCTLWASLSSDF